MYCDKHELENIRVTKNERLEIKLQFCECKVNFENPDNCWNLNKMPYINIRKLFGIYISNLSSVKADDSCWMTNTVIFDIHTYRLPMALWVHRYNNNVITFKLNYNNKVLELNPAVSASVADVLHCRRCHFNRRPDSSKLFLHGQSFITLHLETSRVFKISKARSSTKRPQRKWISYLANAAHRV